VSKTIHIRPTKICYIQQKRQVEPLFIQPFRLKNSTWIYLLLVPFCTFAEEFNKVAFRLWWMAHCRIYTERHQEIWHWKFPKNRWFFTNKPFGIFISLQKLSFHVHVHNMYVLSLKWLNTLFNFEFSGHILLREILIEFPNAPVSTSQKCLKHSHSICVCLFTSTSAFIHIIILYLASRTWNYSTDTVL
jgi:hypothetical protein